VVIRAHSPSATTAPTSHGQRAAESRVSEQGIKRSAAALPPPAVRCEHAPARVNVKGAKLLLGRVTLDHNLAATDRRSDGCTERLRRTSGNVWSADKASSDIKGGVIMSLAFNTCRMRAELINPSLATKNHVVQHRPRGGLN